jgi:hypothetical protein
MASPSIILFDGHNGGFVQNNASPPYEYKRVGCSEIDGQVMGKHSKYGIE